MHSSLVTGPHVIVNVAMTADGKIDSVARAGAAISSSADSSRVDRLRAEVDAILVGGRTLVEGDPRLTVKSDELRAQRKNSGRSENPAKVGVVSVATVAPGSRFMTTGPARRILYTTTRTPRLQIELLERAGAEVFVRGDTRVDLPGMFASLHGLGIRKVMVEGGGTIIAELFRLGLVDELSIYVAARIFGGSRAPTLADGEGFLPDQAPRLTLLSMEEIDDEGGALLRYAVVTAGNDAKSRKNE
jgi:2,5-diamino-6-(ribosylamino)-4(3H)-pyrimidinone 5'-phosphate reductase